MKCHYEVLEVGFEASDAELKKAYRKAALKWHPDKNRDNLEEATMQFQLIQAAYAVLSNPQERQWYDDHRDSILRGEDGDEDGAGDGLDLMRYFSPTCFRGYKDVEGGFYSVYAKVFEEIWDNERFVVEGEEPPPPFGDSSSNYVEVVKPFYRYWTRFTTSNTFASVDKWDTREAPNRQVKRLMEKENKKLRDTARKEFTQKVRQLASFVQGLDRKRKMQHQAAVNLQKEKAQLDQQVLAESERQKRLRDLDAMLAVEETRQDWTAMERDIESLEDHLDAEFGASEQPEASAEAEDWYCVACSKRFKSEKQWSNHQKSKKHLAAVAELREYIEEDDALFAASTEPLTDEIGDGAEEGIPLPDGFDFEAFESGGSLPVPADPPIDVAPTDESKLTDHYSDEDGDGGGDEDDDDDDDDDDMLARMMRGVGGKLSSAGSGAQAATSDESSEGEELAEANNSTNDRGAKESSSAVEVPQNAVEPNSDVTTSSKQETQPGPTKGPRRKKKGKGPGDPRLARVASAEEVVFHCQVCSQDFETRNKLFRHIEATGHAVLRETSEGKGKKGKKKKR
eukprot:m.27868 g.27868  ORF g.27868 m.27868 type:complete len:568 (-) comp6482_c0_seq1:1006-2709(-)